MNEGNFATFFSIILVVNSINIAVSIAFKKDHKKKVLSLLKDDLWEKLLEVLLSVLKGADALEKCAKILKFDKKINDRIKAALDKHGLIIGIKLEPRWRIINFFSKLNIFCLSLSIPLVILIYFMGTVFQTVNVFIYSYMIYLLVWFISWLVWLSEDGYKTVSDIAFPMK